MASDWASHIPSVLLARDTLIHIYVGVSIAILLWDIVLGGQIAQFRQSPAPLAALSAVSALLVAPAVLISAASASNTTGHTFDALSWVSPATMLVVSAQAAYATGRRIVSPALGLPILIYDLLLTVIAATQWVTAAGGSPSDSALALIVAHVNVLGYIGGPATLGWAYALQPPMLAPAFPARGWIAKVMRPLLALVAVGWFAAIMLALPSAMLTVRSYAALGTEPLVERPAGDFTVGVSVLPALEAPPTARALRLDLGLLDTTGAEALSVRIDPRGAHPAALDSLSRALDQLRRDTTALIVTLEYPPDAAREYAASPQAYQEARLAELSRIARALHPDYLIPVDEPTRRGDSALGRPLPVNTWTRFLSAAAFAIHRVDPRVHVAVAVSTFGARDSALYAWVTAPDSPVDAAGFVLRPMFAGAADLDAQCEPPTAGWRRARSRPKSTGSSGPTGTPCRRAK